MTTPIDRWAMFAAAALKGRIGYFGTQDIDFPRIAEIASRMEEEALKRDASLIRAAANDEATERQMRSSWRSVLVGSDEYKKELEEERHRTRQSIRRTLVHLRSAIAELESCNVVPDGR